MRIKLPTTQQPTKPATRRRSEFRTGTRYEATSTRPRMVSHRAHRPWRQGFIRLLGLLGMVFFAFCLFRFFTSDDFFVREITLEGNLITTQEDIAKQTNIIGTNVFWLDPTRLVAELEAMPNIKTAAVNIKYPATVWIKIEDRIPQLVWSSGDKAYWVDADGKAFPSKGELSGAITVVDDDRDPAMLEKGLDPELIAGAAYIHQFLPGQTTIHYSKANGLMLTTPENVPVYLGGGKDIALKITVLNVVREDLATRQVSAQFIDLKDPMRPFYGRP